MTRDAIDHQVAANQNAPVIAIASFSVDVVQERGTGRIYVTEFNEIAKSTEALYDDAYGHNLWADVIAPYYRHLLGNVQILSQTIPPLNPADDYSANVCFSFKPTSAYRRQDKKRQQQKKRYRPTLIVNALHQVLATFDKDSMRALMDPALFPAGEIITPNELTVDRVTHFAGKNKAVIKAPVSSNGQGIYVVPENITSEHVRCAAEMVRRHGKNAPCVIEQFIDAEREVFHGQEYRTWSRVYMSCVLRQDGSFEPEIHGIATEVADHPVTQGSHASMIANFMSGEKVSHKTHIPVDLVLGQRINRFIIDKVAPEFKRLMAAPFDSLVTDALNDTQVKNQHGRWLCLENLRRSIRRSKFNAVFSDAFAFADGKLPVSDANRRPRFIPTLAYQPEPHNT